MPSSESPTSFNLSLILLLSAAETVFTQSDIVVPPNTDSSSLHDRCNRQTPPGGRFVSASRGGETRGSRWGRPGEKRWTEWGQARPDPVHCIVFGWFSARRCGLWTTSHGRFLCAGLPLWTAGPACFADRAAGDQTNER